MKKVVSLMLLVLLAVLIGYTDYCIFTGKVLNNKEFVSLLCSIGFVGFFFFCLNIEEVLK